jgi:hypothetical protein
MTIQDEGLRPGRELSARQLEVWRALRAKSQLDYPFHDWYRGALWALEASDDENPDRLSHAGNSLRELMEKLPRILGTGMAGQGSNVLQQKRESAGTALSRAKAQYPNGWKDQTISSDLEAALLEFEEYITLSARPSRTDQAVSGLQKLDPMENALPEQLRQARLDRYKSLWKSFEGFTHHKPAALEKDIRDCLIQLEDLVLDLMAPITADDQSRILELLARGAKATAGELQEGLLLIGRRGANCAFFFNNVGDPVWLKPLEAAGYFNAPPQIERAGEGYVRFPVWWPMQFLKRVSRDAPDEVLRIILGLDSTDNPQVLDGFVEIAATLPIELSVRLEPVISDYIGKPFHV